MTDWGLMFPEYRQACRQMPRALQSICKRQGITDVKRRSSANATANDGTGNSNCLVLPDTNNIYYSFTENL